MRRSGVRYMWAAVAAVWALCACNPLEELCSDSDHPHTGFLNVLFDWPDATPKDSMYLLALRPLNQYKAAYRVGADRKERNVGQLLFGDTPSKSDTTLLPVPAGGADMAPVLREGEYQLFCFKKTDQGSDLDECLYRFEHEPEYRFEDFVVTLNTYPTISAMEEAHPGDNCANWHDWVNHNPYSGYLSPDPKPFYYSSANASVKNGQWAECRFKPMTNASQAVTFNFTIERKEEGITIDSIKAEVSGSVAHLNPTSREALIDTTYKILFPIPEPAGGWGEGDMQPLTASGMTYTFGIVCSANPDQITGPGILKVGIYARCTDELGLTRRRTFYAITNLYKALKADPQVYYEEEYEIYMQKGSAHTIDIDVPICLTRKRVENHESLDDFFWKDATGSDIYMEF